LLKEKVLTKFARITSVTIALLFAAFLHAQQIDVTVGAGTTLSSKSTSASAAYLPPPEKGGLYPSVSADVILHKHFGFNAEVAVRAKEGLYNGFQGYRPIFFDANAIFVPRLSFKAHAEFMAGVGGVRTLFYGQSSGSYGQSGSCNPVYTQCLTYLNTNHFLAHVGGGIRYDIWRQFFIRPEAHLYIVPNNTPFNSNYVGRVGVSIGYKFDR
jgi:hypothetical protein